MRESLENLPDIVVRESLSQKPGIVDLWYYFYEAEDHPDLVARQQTLLTADEWQRHDRLRFERDRRLFLATRALVRTVLSRYADVPSADWRFRADPQGKPFVLAPATDPPLWFNLANTYGLIVCAVSTVHSTLGVDAERIDRKVEAADIAKQNFSEKEQRALLALPAPEQARRFFDYWTLKESYVKARGMGLSAPLQSFSFDIRAAGVPVEFDGARDERADAWQFCLLSAEPDHAIAVGVESEGTPLSLRARRIIPLG